MFIIIAIGPLVIYQINPGFDEDMVYKIANFLNLQPGDVEGFKLLDFRTDQAGIRTGPFGIGATIVSFGFTLAAGIGLGLFYKGRSSNVIKIKQKTKKLL